MTKPTTTLTSSTSSLQQSLEDGTSRDAKELVCTVDEKNIPTKTGHCRNEMRLQNLWHRATYIIVRHMSQEDVKEKDNEEEFIIVQRRSALKDYCPNKLDPAPGGVVGFGESYKENAEREIEEEMGIPATFDSSDKNANSNIIKQLVIFPYEDDRVKCWGALFEVSYEGKVEDLTLQEEEVSEVMRMSFSELRKSVKENPNDWTPDGLYAAKLYLQYKHDKKVKRKLFPNCSSGSFDNYKLRCLPKAIFFDCDDCLYFDGWKTANQLTLKIDEWCTKRGLPKGEAYKLYKKYGTALRGLLAEEYMENTDEAIDQYLKDVHDIPISTLLSRDDDLRKMIQGINPDIPKYIFTASVKEHAERCLEALGIRDLFVDIIDVRSCNLATKHSVEAFECAMKEAGVSPEEAERCLFLDDSVKNIESARSMGWRAILVGKVGRDCGSIITSDHAEHEIERIHDLPLVCPDLFDIE